MALLARVFLGWTGWQGGPGVNVLHFSEGTTGGSAWNQAIVDSLGDELDALVSGLAGNTSPGVIGQVSPDVDIIDSASGQIVDVKTFTDAPQPYSSAQTNGSVPRATAALVRFSTDQFLNGRRLKGRMFFGPLAATQIDGNGMIVASLANSMPDRFQAITTGIGVRLAVYHRPAVGTATGGMWGDVTSVSCRPTPSSLRSRAF